MQSRQSLRLPHLSVIISALRKPRLTWAAHSVRGAREDNQDAVMMTSPDQVGLVNKRGVLAVVCDGIGGEDGGAIASEVAASTAMRVFYASDATDDAAAVRAAVNAANLAVQETAMRESALDDRLARMGTTIVMAAVTVERVTIGHVGDSRAYVLCPGAELRQLTRDHVGEDHSGLARSLGAIGRSDGDIACETFGPGARLLLCTDGLYRAMPQSAIAACLSGYGTAETLARDLVAAAFANNSRDNISAAVIACDTGISHMRGLLRAVQKLVMRRRGNP
jgi:protein phosphatase